MIRRQYVYLINTLNVRYSDLLDHLLQEEVLDVDALAEIRSEMTTKRQVQKLLAEISRHSSENFMQFLTALDNCHQKHVADTLRSGINDSHQYSIVDSLHAI